MAMKPEMAVCQRTSDALVRLDLHMRGMDGFRF